MSTKAKIATLAQTPQTSLLDCNVHRSEEGKRTVPQKGRINDLNRMRDVRNVHRSRHSFASVAHPPPRLACRAQTTVFESMRTILSRCQVFRVLRCLSGLSSRDRYRGHGRRCVGQAEQRRKARHRYSLRSGRHGGSRCRSATELGSGKIGRNVRRVSSQR